MLKFIFNLLLFFLLMGFNGQAHAAVVTPSEKADIVWTDEELSQGIAKRVLVEDDKNRHVMVRLAESEKPHSHEEDLTAWLITGEALLHIEGRQYPMKAGDVTRIPKNVTHWAELADGGICEIYAIYHK